MDALKAYWLGTIRRISWHLSSVVGVIKIVRDRSTFRVLCNFYVFCAVEPWLGPVCQQNTLKSISWSFLFAWRLSRSEGWSENSGWKTQVLKLHTLTLLLPPRIHTVILQEDWTRNPSSEHVLEISKSPHHCIAQTGLNSSVKYQKILLDPKIESRK